MIKPASIKWLTLAALACATEASAGPDWVEGGDGGEVPASAQNVSPGTGPVKTIMGDLATARRLGDGTPDFADMYRIRICDPVFFCAHTEAEFDPQLWLFDESGYGILANDNRSPEDRQSLLFPPANDDTWQVIREPGVYLLAISGAGYTPVSPAGHIFEIASPDERSGPDGPGSQMPIEGWTGQTEQQGHYLIYLEGAAFLDDLCDLGDYVDTPCIPTVSEWGMIVMALLLAGAGTLVLRNGIPSLRGCR